MEKYMAFMLSNHLTFIDSFQFMSSSLDKLDFQFISSSLDKFGRLLKLRQWVNTMTYTLALMYSC